MLRLVIATMGPVCLSLASHANYLKQRTAFTGKKGTRAAFIDHFLHSIQGTDDLIFRSQGREGIGPTGTEFYVMFIVLL